MAKIPEDPVKFANRYGIRLCDVRAYELRNGVESVARKYESQRASSKKRGIEWLFDLRGWLEIWDGKISKRGQGLRAFCMCRHKDQGPYAPWNVRIATGYENKLDWWERKSRWFGYKDDSRRSVSYGRTVDSNLKLSGPQQ